MNSDKKASAAPLDDAQLEQAAGGFLRPAPGKTTQKCPECGSGADAQERDGVYYCPGCGHCYGSKLPWMEIV